MIFNEKAFFNDKPTKIITKLIIVLNETVDLIKVQPASDFEDIQILKDFINIDSPEDDIEDDRFSNKPLDKGFYLILPLSVYDYLDYIDFFIFIRSKGMEKKVITVIIAISII